MLIKAFHKVKKDKGLIKKVILFLLVPVALWILIPYIKRLFDYIRNSANAVGSTMTTEQAQARASALRDAFDNILDNYDIVAQLLAGITTADYFKIKGEFGVKLRSYLGGAPMEDTFFNSMLAEPLNLTEWLVRELNQEQLTMLKAYNPNLNAII